MWSWIYVDLKWMVELILTTSTLHIKYVCVPQPCVCQLKYTYHPKYSMWIGVQVCILGKLHIMNRKFYFVVLGDQNLFASMVGTVRHCSPLSFKSLAHILHALNQFCVTDWRTDKFSYTDKLISVRYVGSELWVAKAPMWTDGTKVTEHAVFQPHFEQSHWRPINIPTNMFINSYGALFSLSYPYPDLIYIYNATKLRRK